MKVRAPQITERHIRELNNINDNILDNAPIAIYVIDRDFIVLKWNKYLEKSTLIKKADILGQNLIEVVPEIRSSERYEAMLRVMANGEPFHELGQKMLRNVGAQKGEVRYQDVTIVPLRDQGEIVGAITILSDVTERKLADEKVQQVELEVAQGRARLADFSRIQAMGEMTTIIAHEISQPLASIDGYAQAAINRLESGDGDLKKLIELLTKIKVQSNRASGIIENTRSRLKKHKLELTLVDLNQLVEETIKLTEIEFVLHDCTLHLVLSDAPLLVMADEIQIQRVIVNLLRNAIEAVKGLGKEDRLVEVSTLCVDKNIELAVADRGPGVDNEGRLFEPFYSTKDEGLGIGLHLCRSIMDKHGGVASYSRGAGARTEFRIVFPSRELGGV